MKIHQDVPNQNESLTSPNWPLAERDYCVVEKCLLDRRSCLSQRRDADSIALGLHRTRLD